MTCRSTGVLALVAVLAGCESESLVQILPGQPDTTGAAVWQHLQNAEYQANWQTWPGKAELYTGQDPHGMLLTTYLNEAAYDALLASAGRFPPGAIIVKENYMPDSTLAAITTMYKVRGYNPQGADWFWVKHLPDGSVDEGGAAQGRVAMCIDCHGARSENDYIYTGSLQ
ncbi:MAG: cytochrome P460 family protein [Gemmatimonadales bacterium]